MNIHGEYINSFVEKVELIHWITELQDISVLNEIRSIKENTSEVSISEMLSIEKGFDDFQKGKVLPHTQVKKRYEKWL